MFRLATWWQLSGVVVLTLASSRAEDAKPGAETILFDFTQSGLGDTWTAQGKIQAGRTKPPETPPGEGTVPEGEAVELTAGPGGLFFTKQGQLKVDWPKVRQVAFWLYRSSDEARQHPKAAMEVRFYEGDNRSWFWRRVDLDHTGWKRFEVPLAWCRWGEGHVPRWGEVNRLVFSFRNESRVWIDNIATVAGNADQGAALTWDQLREVAFPGKPEGEVKLVRRDHVAVMSDAQGLDADALAGHLGKASTAVYADLPFLKPPPATDPAPLVVFATRESYRAFAPRFAEHELAQIPPPTSGGFTLQGIATSSWDPAQGTLRPVYTHEFIHAFVGRSALLDNKGEWFHEGLASVYQLRFHPQANFGQLVRKSLDDARPSLEKLCNGQKIELNEYWAAATLIELLLARDKYKPRLPALVAEFQKTGSTDLGPHLRGVLATSWGELTADWVAFCAEKYRE